MRYNDFDYSVLGATARRPWPMPASPWIMTQTWHDLLFAHWQVDAAALRERLPAGFELDLFDGHAWLAVVPFRMTNVAPRGIPSLPWMSSFPELNVRTYVRVRGVPGVYFFSLDAANPIAVWIARTFVHLPYYSASMQLEPRHGWIDYKSRRTSSRGKPAELVASYRPTEDVREPVEGTIEYFLTERYCLFTVDGAARTRRLDIHHPPWRLQAAEAEVSVNTMAVAAGIGLPRAAPLLHFSRRQDVVTWPLRSIDPFHGGQLTP